MLYVVCRWAQVRLATPGQEEATRCTRGDDGCWTSSTRTIDVTEVERGSSPEDLVDAYCMVIKTGDKQIPGPGFSDGTWTIPRLLKQPWLGLVQPWNPSNLPLP